jgi:hypothetical protein
MQSGKKICRANYNLSCYVTIVQNVDLQNVNLQNIDFINGKKDNVKIYLYVYVPLYIGMYLADSPP